MKLSAQRQCRKKTNKTYINKTENYQIWFPNVGAVFSFMWPQPLIQYCNRSHNYCTWQPAPSSVLRYVWRMCGTKVWWEDAWWDVSLGNKSSLSFAALWMLSSLTEQLILSQCLVQLAVNQERGGCSNCSCLKYDSTWWTLICLFAILTYCLFTT